MPWYKIAFTDDDEEDPMFLGTAVVSAPDLDQALALTYQLDINPGGNFSVATLDKAPPRRFVNRRLNRDLSEALENSI